MWKQMIKNDQEEMKFLVETVARVHGEKHPEITEVAEFYNQLLVSDEPEEIFHQLRQVTDNYEIPEDVCPTFEKVYLTLKTYDQAFQEGGK